MIDDLYTVREAVGTPRPVIASIPHTGTKVPAAIAAQFANPDIAALPMTDWHLHLLYDFLPAMGVTTVAARYSRFVVDLNRPPVAMSLYPGRFETGLVATETFAGERIYRAPPNADEVESRRVAYHAPYHQCLAQMLAQRSASGPVVLLDLHSVISAANKLHGPLEREIYLGDRDGTSAPGWLLDAAADAFGSAGLSVSRNDPYKGGYTTAHYGKSPDVYALQVEMCQRVYMDETQPAHGPDSRRFAEAKDQLAALFAPLLQHIDRHL